MVEVADANAVASYRLLPHSHKKLLITNYDSPRLITSTIARLRIQHYKVMKIPLDKTRSYLQCKNCQITQPFTPRHIFECPALVPKALKLGLVPLMKTLQEMLYLYQGLTGFWSLQSLPPSVVSSFYIVCIHVHEKKEIVEVSSWQSKRTRS